jgi:hypothetical protein
VIQPEDQGKVACFIASKDLNNVTIVATSLELAGNPPCEFVTFCLAVALPINRGGVVG